MQTYTHYLITAVIDRRLKTHAVHQNAGTLDAPRPSWLNRLPRLRSGWFLFGSIAPDIPLITITIFYLIMDLSQGCAMAPSDAAQAASQCIQPDGQTGSHLGYLFNYMFFHEPWVKAAHNIFHAPLPIFFYIGLGYWLVRSGRAPHSRWGSALFWFGLACLLHTAIDIPLHYNDGPLLLFPLEWETRFRSPISYWDPAAYGSYFVIFEHLLALGLLLYLLTGWWRNRRRKPKVMVHPAAGR